MATKDVPDSLVVKAVDLYAKPWNRSSMAGPTKFYRGGLGSLRRFATVRLSVHTLTV